MKRYYTLLAMSLLFAMTGCRKDLCYNHDEHALTVKTEAVITWEQEWERKYDIDWKKDWPSKEVWELEYDSLRPGIPSGVRALVYPAEETAKYIENNIDSTGGRVGMPEGKSSILFYNNDTEYLLFNDLSGSVSATATTRGLSRGGFQELHNGERTINLPDMLYGHYEQDYIAERTLEPVFLPVTMRPLVYTYYIRYEFKHGQDYVALARGALAGMAERIYLKDGHTDDEAATLMFECSIEPFGAQAVITSFGVPNYPGDHYTRGNGSKANFMLNLEVRMLNGKYKTFEIDVTDQVVKQPRGGVIVVKDLEITDEEGLEGSSGFDVEVEGWGDVIDIPLPLN